MAKSFRSWCAVAIALAAFSCSPEEILNPDATDNNNYISEAPVFSAELETTKTTIDDGRKVSWSVSDEINVNGAVFATDAVLSDGSAKFNIKEGESMSSAKPYKAYYPASIVSGSVAVLPAVQVYEQGKFNMPLYAESNNTTLYFNHITAVLKIVVGSSTGFASVTDITVSSADKALSGAFTVQNNTAVLNEPNVKSRTTRLSCASSSGGVSVSSEAGVFYIAVPAQSYGRLFFRVEGKDAEGASVIKTMATKLGGTISMDRNTIYTINFAENYESESVNILEGRNLSLSKYTASSSVPGSPQGAAYYDGKIYQFKTSNDSTKDGVFTEGETGVDVYDLTTGEYKIFNQKVVNKLSHVGSATFGKKIFTKADGYEYDCTIPFVYVTGHYAVDGGSKYEVIDMLDIEHAVTVKHLTFPDLTDDAIAAYDFDNNKIWMLGYPMGVEQGRAPYLFREFNVPLDDINLEQTNFTTWNWEARIGGPDDQDHGGEEGSAGYLPDGLQKTLSCGTLQDAYYKDGYIYYATGRGAAYNRTEYVKAHAIKVSDIQNGASGVLDETVIVLPTYGEQQGFVYDEDNDVFYSVVPASNGVWAYKHGTGNDLYNFEPAHKVAEDTYTISNGSQLVWFIGQIYGGRTCLKGTLACDIDMMGINVPFCVYVYETPNATTGKRIFDAQYAFRGVFDGAGHTISNLSITNTAYSNCGLFPYVIGATIKNVTVEGGLTMSKPVDYDYPTENIGFIGYMDGGTVSGVNVADFAINVSTFTLTKTVNSVPYSKEFTPTYYNQLIGNAVNVTTSGNVIASEHDASAADGGHVYVNGVCVSTGDCDAKYQPATEVSGVYQIANAGNLIWFANAINAGYADSRDGSQTSYPDYIAANSKAVLTADIDLKGGKYGSFPAIGIDANHAFTGEFDGQGHTINNFYQNQNAYRTGMFTYLKGASSTEVATVKDFTLNGNKTVSTSSAMHGAVVGDANQYSLIEDVNCYVNISSTSTCAILGGVAGSLSSATAVMNRCRYSGTFLDGTIIKQVGGLVGDLRGGTVKNSLFDGTIVRSSTSSELNVGGIVGNNANSGGKILNCLSVGTLTMSKASGKVGLVIGSSVNSLTISNTYYRTSGSSIPAVDSCAVAPSGTPVSADEMSNADLRFNLGEINWDNGTDYPVPFRHGEGVHEHVIGEDGYCIGNDGYFVEPSLVGDYYQISNQAQMFWFANYVNAGNTSINAKLTADIDLGNRDFTAIAVYSGIFDGNGYKISGYKLTNATSTSGFFRNTSGATLKNFTLEGKMILSHTGSTAFHAGIVALAQNNTQIIGVTSDVDIECTTANPRVIGGVVGRLSNGSLSGCRYSGTITSKDAYDQVAGICANSQNTVSIEDCLFDGSIVSQYSGTNEVKIAGILSATDGAYNTMTRCLSNGTISVQSGINHTSVGIVFGKMDNANSFSLSNGYYTTDGATIGSDTYSQYGGAVKSNASVSCIEKTSEISWSEILTSLGSGWQMGTSGYPIPKQQ